ncbi:hypothetical protein [Streptomyces sp. NPDC055749]
MADTALTHQHSEFPSRPPTRAGRKAAAISDHQVQGGGNRRTYRPDLGAVCGSGIVVEAGMSVTRYADALSLPDRVIERMIADVRELGPVVCTSVCCSD